MTFETVAVDTPERSATSLSVVLRGGIPLS